VDESGQLVAQRGGGPRAVATRLRRPGVVGLCVLTLSLLLAACSSSPNSSTGTTATTSGGAPPPSGTAPGVTSRAVTVGQIDDLTIPIPGLFLGAKQGTEAYFDYINSMGGVDGRKINLDAEDSMFTGGTIASETATMAQHDFAMVGGFSLLDSSEKTIIDLERMPDVSFSLSTSMIVDPNVYSSLPNPANDYPLGFFRYLKKKYPSAVRHVGILWEDATASTQSSESAFEGAMKAAGFKIIYDRGAGPFETSFLSDILAMKAKGVQLFYTLELPDNFAATVAEEMQQQNFHPMNIEGDAYSSQLIKLGGSAVNGMYIVQSYALYLGQDASSVPAVALFDKWMRKVNPNPDFEIESVYGWTSAELFVQALKAAGPEPTRAGLIEALDKITNFNTGGLAPPSNPGQNVPTNCFLLAQVQKGKIVRVAPSPKSGFDCSSGGFLPAPGFTPEVRPAPTS
jgi:ABC-type branched-subunit amino acid transport system substrate-binding protein